MDYCLCRLANLRLDIPKNFASYRYASKTLTSRRETRFSRLTSFFLADQPNTSADLTAAWAASGAILEAMNFDNEVVVPDKAEK
jgi:hypothetical protein